MADGNDTHMDIDSPRTPRIIEASAVFGESADSFVDGATMVDFEDVRCAVLIFYY